MDPAGFVTEYRRAVQVFRDAYRDIQVEGLVTAQVERKYSNPIFEELSQGRRPGVRVFRL